MWSFVSFLVTLTSLLIAIAGASASKDEGSPFDWSLIPARHHMLDALEFRHLQPSKEIELFFEAADDPEVYASSTQQQKLHSVVLEHSAYIQHVTCTEEIITIVFDSVAAVTFAREWPSRELVLITNHKTCNPRNERGVYSIKGPWQWAQNSPLQIKAQTSKVDWQETTSTLELTYGVKSQNSTEADHRPNQKRDATSCDVVRKHRKACGGAICGRQGVIMDPHIIWRTTATSRDNGRACAKACLADTNCKAFSFHKKTGYCSAYGKRVKAQNFSREQSELYFYDRDCWQVDGSCNLGAAPNGSAPSSLIPARGEQGYTSKVHTYGGQDASATDLPHQTSSVTHSLALSAPDDARSIVASSANSHGVGRPSAIASSFDGLNLSSSPVPHDTQRTSSVTQSSSTITLSGASSSFAQSTSPESQGFSTSGFSSSILDSSSSPSSSSSVALTDSTTTSRSLSSRSLSTPSFSSASSLERPTTSGPHSSSIVPNQSAEPSSPSTGSTLQTTSSSSSTSEVSSATSWLASNTGAPSFSSSFEPSSSASSIPIETLSSHSTSVEASTSSLYSSSSSISTGSSTSHTPSTTSSSSIEPHSTSSAESSSLSSHTITHTSSDVVSVTTSAISSTASAERRLNAYELYLFSLFYDGMVETPEGYIVADLGANGTTNPVLGLDLPDFNDIADQTRLRQRCIDAGLPSGDEFFALATTGLAAAANQRWTALPTNIIETLPPYLELSPLQPVLKRAVERSNITDLDIPTSSLQKRGGLFDLVLGPITEELAWRVLEATCTTCYQVYEVYNKLTDPFWIAGQVCTACQPVLEIAEKILNPVNILMTVFDWLFDFGKYRPQGNPLPPPQPIRKIPPPIEAKARINGRIDFALPAHTFLPGRAAHRQPNDVLICVDCRISVPSFIVLGKVVFSVDQRRVLEAVFEVDMHSNFKTSMQLKAVAWQHFRESISAGSTRLGNLAAPGFFSIDIDYTHTIHYDVETQGDVDLTFGMEGRIDRGYGKLDLSIPRILAQNGFAPSFQIAFPALRSAANGRFTFATQGVVTINVHLMGTSTPHFAVASSAEMAVEARVMMPGQPGFGSPGTCGLGETQVDAWIGSETRMLGQRVVRGDQPLGRRCFKLKSLAESAGAPPQPYCGPSDIEITNQEFRLFDYKKGTYRIECSSKLSDAVPIEEYRTDITTFNECLEWCHWRPDCRFASWEIRDYPLKCLLFSDINSPEHTWWGFYVEKLIAPPPRPSIPPRPPATLSRPPIQHTTLPPAALFPFTTPSGAPAPPLPTNYPPRNEEGWCGGLKEGSHTIDQAPMDVQYDIECGTIIDYTGITLTSLNMDFETCLFQCRYYNTDCQAVMVQPADQPDSCVFLTSFNAQRYSTNDSVALAIKVRNGEGVNWK